MVANIWVAAADDQLSIVKAHIESGKFSANSKDVNGYTPIHAAVSYGHLDLLDYLIAQGGDINIQDSEGDSPLHHTEDVKVAKHLVEDLKADTKLKNNDGQTPLQYIEEEDEFPDLIKYLRSVEIGGEAADAEAAESTLPKDGEIIDGHQIRYSYERQPDEIALMDGLTQEQREAKLKEIAESDNPEALIKELVTNAVHKHMNPSDQDFKKRKNA